MAERDENLRALALLERLDARLLRDVVIAREPRIDRYGIRMAVEVDGEALKLEIVSEGRVELLGEDDPALLTRSFDEMSVLPEARAIVGAKLAAVDATDDQLAATAGDEDTRGGAA